MTRLNLSDNSIGGHFDEPGVHALADMLKNNTILKEINISSNSLDEECAQILAPAIKDNGAISSLNLANNNNIGQLVPPDGWRAEDADGAAPWIHTDGQRVEDGMPEGSMPVGVIALANVIPDMRAMTSLNLASNYLESRGAKIVVEAIKVTKCTPAISMAPFSCSSVFSINCCCLLLSAGYGGPIVCKSSGERHRHRTGQCSRHHPQGAPRPQVPLWQQG
jgi:hypothetical protein